MDNKPVKTCVHCGRAKDRHVLDTLRCPGSAGSEGAVFGTRDLPAGMTCADCAYFARTCKWLIDYKGTETACDWWPIRFAGPIQRQPGASTTPDTQADTPHGFKGEQGG